jgi:hypothetical protein
VSDGSAGAAALVKARKDADATFSGTFVGTTADPCPTKPLWIRLALAPSKAPLCQDRFEVKSTDGKYQKTKTVATDHLVNDESVDLEFTDAFIDKRYEIRVIPPNGPPYFILRDVPFAELAHNPPDEKPELVALSDDPRPEEVAGYDGPAQPPENRRSGGGALV